MHAAYALEGSHGGDKLQASNLCSYKVSFDLMGCFLLFYPKYFLQLLHISNSMRPTINKGDVLFITNQNEAFSIGDIVAFNVKERDVVVVHRIVRIHGNDSAHQQILTKADSNRVDDRGLYPKGEIWLPLSSLIGKVRGKIM